MNKENPSFARKAESASEKIGGGLITVFGAITLDVALVAIGLTLIFIGKAREPKRENKTS